MPRAPRIANPRSRLSRTMSAINSFEKLRCQVISPPCAAPLVALGVELASVPRMCALTMTVGCWGHRACRVLAPG